MPIPERTRNKNGRIRKLRSDKGKIRQKQCFGQYYTHGLDCRQCVVAVECYEKYCGALSPPLNEEERQLRKHPV